MSHRLGAVASVVIAVALAAPPAHAQGFTNACGGTTFFSCVTLSITSSNGGATQMFTITNTSTTAAGNPNSNFSLFGVGSTSVSALPFAISTSAGPAFERACGSASISGCANSSPSNVNTFQGAGFTSPVFFGLGATPPPAGNGLHDGQTASFFLFFNSATDATAFLNGLQFAAQDIGGLTDACGSSKVVFNANGTPTSASSNPTNASTCNGRPSTVPEPSSLALLGSGLIGVVPMLRRRRSA